MRKQLIINSLSGGLQLIIATFLVFFTIPIFISKLGVELYGIFSLLLVITSLNTFLNLGLNTALIKFLSEQGKTIESNYDIVTSLIIFCVVIIPATIIVIIFRDFILLHILGLPQKYLGPEIEMLFVFLILSSMLNFIGQIPVAILDSQQKIFLTNFIQIIYNILYWSLILTSLFIFSGIKYIGLGIFLASVIWFSIIVLAAIKNWNFFNLDEYNNNFKRIFIKQIGYGSKLYASGIISFFYEPVSKILLSHFIGLSSVGFFDIALRVRTQIWTFITKILYPIFPLISQLTDKEKVRLLVHDIEQKTAYLLIPVFLSVFFVTRPFINIWIGKNVEIISISVTIMVSFFLLAVVVVPNYQYLIAKGHAAKTIYMQASNVFFNALFFLLTFRELGYYAILLANASAIVSSFLISIYYQNKYLQSLIFDDLVQFLKFILILLAGLIIGFVLNFIIENDIIKIVSLPAIFAVISIILYRELNVFSETDTRFYFGSKGRYANLFRRLLIK